MRKIILVSGRLCSGRSGLSKLLEKEFGFLYVKTTMKIESIANSRKIPVDRQQLQNLGDKLDSETGGKWLLEYVLDVTKEFPREVTAVVDCIRTRAQLEMMRQHSDFEVVHVHLYAPSEELKRRFIMKYSPSVKEEEYSHFDHMKKEADIVGFKRDADIRINTARTDERDTLVRVAAGLKLYSPPDVRCVDVIVGGQYGSEGKGHIAAYLAKDYDILMRVGGPNAGHTVSSHSGVYTYHQLPSGAKDTEATLLLGPGMTIHVPSLLSEIRDCKLKDGRLIIDSQAMIIEESDMSAEAELVKRIASTGRGSGKAQARRIIGRGDKSIRLARDIPELKSYVGSTNIYLEKAYRQQKSILLEGTQGSGLSLYHGPYPYVTSRDTNVAGCLAEAGISPSRVRKILMVVRSTPIRVANPDGNEGHTSGNLKHEVEFDTVAISAGLDPAEVNNNEKTSTTKRNRRVGWFEWEQFRLACALNAPTDIVLTFADYIHVDNRDARRFEQLTEDTIKFIEELERVAQAPVSIINTRFPRGEEKIDIRTTIDRRNWTTKRVATYQ